MGVIGGIGLANEAFKTAVDGTAARLVVFLSSSRLMRGFAILTGYNPVAFHPLLMIVGVRAVSRALQ